MCSIGAQGEVHSQTTEDVAPQVVGWGSQPSSTPLNLTLTTAPLLPL